MVQTVAATSLTVLTFVFSVTLVAVQVAASQYSPRLPRQFIQDRATRFTMGTFVFTFVYSLAVLRSIDATADRVPQFAVTLAFIFVLGTVATFAFFVHHIVHAIRIERVLDRTRDGALRAVKAYHPSLCVDDGDPEGGWPAGTPGSISLALRAPRSGYVQAPYAEELVEFARAHDIVLCFVPSIGRHVIDGAVLAEVYLRPDDPRARHPTALLSAIEGEFASIAPLKDERSTYDDPGFGLVQIIDIALRAVSPAINDPTTARTAIGSAAVVLDELGRRDLRERRYRDDRGLVRGVVTFPAYGDYLDLAVTPLRRSSADDVGVISTLLGMLVELHRRLDGQPERRRSIDRAVELVIAAAGRAIEEEADMHTLRRIASDGLSNSGPNERRGVAVGAAHADSDVPRRDAVPAGSQAA